MLVVRPSVRSLNLESFTGARGGGAANECVRLRCVQGPGEKGGGMNTSNEKKNDFPCSTDFKLLSQINGSTVNVCDV